MTNWDWVVLLGLAIAIPVFLKFRGHSELPRWKLMLLVGTSMSIIGFCLAVASWQSFQAGVLSPGILVGLSTLGWFYLTFCVLWRIGVDMVHAYKYYRREERKRALRNKAIELFEGMDEDEQAEVIALAQEWKKGQGESMLHLNIRDLALRYIEAITLKRESA